MCAAYHRRPVVHISNDGLDNRCENLRPARFGEVVVTSRDMVYAVNEQGQFAHDLIVKWMYQARNKSQEDAQRWSEYCSRAEDDKYKPKKV